MGTENRYIRPDIFPSGACIEGDAVEAFELLDSGTPDDGLIAMAREACQNCLQLEYCQESRTAIGSLLFRGQGNQIALIGGQELTEDKTDRPIRQYVTEPVIKFDMSQLPHEPHRALHSLRRAVRAKQLATGPHTPATIPPVASRIEDLIGERNGELLLAIKDPPHMSARRAERGIQRLVQLLFMQADYRNYSAGKGKERRYRIDPNNDAFWNGTLLRWSNIVELFAEDMLTLDRNKLKKPEAQALVFSPAEYGALISVYSGQAGLPPSVVQEEIAKWLNDPEQKLREIQARLHVLREEHHGTRVTESILANRARWKLPEGPTSTDLRPKTPPKTVSISIVAAILEGKPVDEEYASVKQTIEAILETVGDDDFLRRAPYALARYCILPADQAITKYIEAQGRINGLLAQRPKDDKVPISFVKDYGHRHSAQCDYAAVTKSYHTSKARLRLLKRARGLPGRNTLKTWMLNHAYDLSDDLEDFRAMSEGLYALTCVNQLLTTGLTEMRELQDANYVESISAIVNDKTGRYVAFAPQLRRLTTSERLVLASHFRLGRLLYGQHIDSDQLAADLSIDDMETYVDEYLLPKCHTLIHDQSQPQGLPISILQLSNDIFWLRHINNTDSRPDTPELPDITSVIGGEAIRLGPHALDLYIQSNSEATWWLKRILLQRCSPWHLEVAPHVEQAILDDVLRISGEEPESYRIAFAPYLTETGDEQQLAALAHVLGIDQFMYGVDLGKVLQERLETTIEAAAQPLINLVANHQLKQSKTPRTMKVIDIVWLRRYLLKSTFDHDEGRTEEALRIINQEITTGTLQVIQAGRDVRLRFSDAILAWANPADLHKFVQATGVNDLLDTDSQNALRRDTIQLRQHHAAFQALHVRAQYALSALTSKFVHDLPEGVRKTFLVDVMPYFLFTRRHGQPQHDRHSQQFRQLLAVDYAAYRDRAVDGGSSEVLARVLTSRSNVSVRDIIADQPSSMLASPSFYYQQYMTDLIQFNSWLQYHPAS